MKLIAAIAIHVPAEEVLRELRFFERIRRAFGGKPDLRTGRTRASIEATAIVESARDALRTLGVSNAIALTIDDTTLFHDREAKPDDLGDLLIAFHDNQSVFGQGFTTLSLAVEHREAGLHLVIDVTARSEHASAAPTVRIVTSGRVTALAPLAGEDADAYRARTASLVKDPDSLATYELQFRSFVERLRDALATALPIGRVVVEGRETRIVRPQTQPTTPAQSKPDPTSRAYDPFDYYYPAYYAEAWVDAWLWLSIFEHAHHPHYAVVDAHNHFQGHTDDPGIETGRTASAESNALWNADDTTWGSDEDAARSNDDTSTDDTSSDVSSDESSWGTNEDSSSDSSDFDSGSSGGFDFSFDD